jgi:chaperonin GroEL
MVIYNITMSEQSSGKEKVGAATVIFGDEARAALVDGIKLSANAIACTMGPRGRCVIIKEQNVPPVVTKDGATVAKALKPKDRMQSLGADLIREASSKTNDAAGDGTTTAAVLAMAMVVEGMKLLAAGHQPSELSNGVELMVDETVKVLREASIAVDSADRLKQVATISANGEMSVGNVVTEALAAVGADGVVAVEDAKSMATTLEIVEGMRFERGYLSPYFVTDSQRMVATYTNVAVFLCDKRVQSLADIVPALEEARKANRPIIIIAEEVEGDALQGLILNKVHADLKVIAIRSPGIGNVRDELLGDIAALTGASVVSSKLGLEPKNVKLTHMGCAKRITVDAKTTTIVGTGSTTDKVNERAEGIRGRLNDVRLTSEEREILRFRLARLTSGAAIVKVGGSTELEITERRHRVEDAMCAARAAAEEGIVPGGGIALLRAAERAITNLNLAGSFQAGADIVRRACAEPFRRILLNAGMSPEAELRRLGTTEGLDVRTGAIGDMLQLGVVDPVKVSRVALENAASIARTFLSLDAIIVND